MTALQTTATIIFSASGIFVLFVIFLAYRNSDKNLTKFINYIKASGINIKEYKRLLTLLCIEVNQDYGETIYGKQEEIIFGCVDYKLTPYEFLEKELININIQKVLSPKHKTILKLSLILAIENLIKTESELFEQLEAKNYFDFLCNNKMKGYNTLYVLGENLIYKNRINDSAQIQENK